MKCKCEDCAMREACQYTFGDYWATLKSRGGEGCDHPLPLNQRDDILEGEQKRAEDTPLYGGYIEPDPIETETKSPAAEWHKYWVSHEGREYPTAAKSEAMAINQVRFSIYGTKPRDQLPPFSARIAQGKMTRDEMRHRLARLVA